MVERKAKKPAGRAAAKTARKPAPRPAPRVTPSDPAASRLITERIHDVGGWRGQALERMRSLLRKADPEIVEEVKWRKPSNPAGVPVWSHDGMVCTGEIYKDAVKLTFAQGAKLDDPARLFNASLTGGLRRAIDIREGDVVDERAFRALVREAVAFNVGKRGRRA